MTKKTEKIKVLCYGQWQEFKSSREALDYFLDAYNCCDPASSEAGRYMFIANKIMDGEKTITDNDY